MDKDLEAIQNVYRLITEFVVQYSFQILGALIILAVGMKTAGWLANITIKMCEKHKVDITLTRFMGNIVKVLVIVFVIIITIGKFGISIAPIVAALGAVAFGASFAIQGPLSNYGAGISLILTRPFVIGNTINVQGVSGVVEEVKLAATVLTNEDGEQITIPNKQVLGEVLHNSFANKIVEISVGISYANDPEDAIRIINKVLTEQEEVCQDPPPQVGIDQFADSAINIGMRYWVPTKKYFQLRFQVNGAIHKALLAGNINIPFPQRDVRIVSGQKAT